MRSLRTDRSRSFMLLLALTGATLARAAEVPFADEELVVGLDDTYTPLEADVDGDGDLDLIVNVGTTMIWLEQTAGGSPPVYAQHSLVNVSASHVPVDLDRDGDLDVALLYTNADDDLVLSWAENDGTPANGAWQIRGVRVWNAPLFGWAYGSGLVAADLDGDGDPDLALAHEEFDAFATDPDGRILWLRSDGSPQNGGWSEEPLYDWVLDRTFDTLRVTDLDGDGDLDLVALSRDTDSGIFNSVSWFENDGTPGVGYWTRRIIESTANWPVGVEVGDLDGDGDPDVVFDPDGDPLRWYQNDGSPANGGWVEREIAGESLFGMQTADVDRDGDLDLTGWGRWLDNDGSPADGGWTRRLLPFSQPAEPIVVDVDEDGDLDFLRGRFLVAPEGIAWEENTSLHRSALLRDEHVVNSFVDGAFDVVAGDLDGDGDLDLVSAAVLNDHIYWHRNDGTPGNNFSWNLSTLSDTGAGPRAVAVGDLDGDGDLDVVVASFDDDTVAWLENDGTLAGWTRRVISAFAGGASDVVVADFDRDGDLDVACAQYLDDEITWYRNNGASPPAFGGFFVDSTPYNGPRALAVGDLDGDGDADLAAVSEIAEAVVWYSNDGSPADGEWFRHRTDNGDASGPKDVAVADLDRDGDLDTIVAASASDAVYWYENDGTFAGWTQRAVNLFCGGARGLATGDFDADGDPDVLVSCYDDDAIWLARSNGGVPPSFVSALVTTSGSGVRAVAAADLDRDGDLDGVSAQGTDDQIAWYENQGGQFRVVGTVIATNPLGSAGEQGIFRAVVAHRGRSGDGQMELSAVAVRLEETPGDPLNPFQAASLIDFVRVHGDDGDNVFEPGVDPLLASAPVAGIDILGDVWVDLPDDLPAAAISATAQKTFFVALELADPPLGPAPPTLVVTLLTDGDDVCEAEDRSFDLPLALEGRANVSTAVLVVSGVFRDGFESGDTSRWSATSP